MKNNESSEIYAFNKQAMEYLKHGKVVTSERFLLRAQNLLKTQNSSPKTSRLWAITCNNLACVYKSSGNYEKALTNLFLALETEEKYIKNPLSTAGTYLNISSIYSKMNLHKISLKYSTQAQTILVNHPLQTESYYVSLVTSYLSTGKEHELMLQTEKALKNFISGLEISENHLGKQNILTLKLKKSLSQLLNENRALSMVVSRNLTPTVLKNNQKKPTSLSPNAEKSLPLLKTPKTRKNNFLSGKKRRFAQNSDKSEIRYFKNSARDESQVLQNQDKGLELVSDGTSSALSSVSEDIETKKMCESNEPQEFGNKEGTGKIERLGTKNPGFKDESEEIGRMRDESVQTETEIRDGSVGGKIMKNESVQTYLRAGKDMNKIKFADKKCQTVFESPKFRRIASIVIQRFWRNYRRQKMIVSDKVGFVHQEESLSKGNILFRAEVPVGENIFVHRSDVYKG